MENKARLEKIATTEDREFTFLDSEISFEKFVLELFGEDYDANSIKEEVMRFVNV